MRKTEQSWDDLVQEVAREKGKRPPSEDEVENILWEHTAFPLAGDGYIRRQLEEYFDAAPTG